MKKTILPGIVVLLTLLGSASAATRLVPVEYTTIQNAIDAAVNGDVVIVAPGIYTGLGNRDIDFGGKEITVQSTDPQNPDVVTATVIDCQGMEAEPHRGFYFHLGEDGNSVLSGLTITNGFAGYGGGIYCLRSHPTITNCAIFNNMAKYWWDPREQFSALPPHENRSSMVNDDGEVHINIPPPQPGWKGMGGGFFCQLSSPTLTDCKFIGNSAYEYGGGMHSYNDSSPNLINCTFISNTATAGGAIRHSTGSLRLYNCIFNSNSAGWGGGAIMNSNSDTFFFNCIFNGNSTGGEGGVILNYHCHPMLINCTFSRNSAGYGGVIFNTGSDATLSNCILRGNTATKGNEIHLDFYTDFWGSETPSTINVDYSDVEGGAAGVYVDTDCTLNWGEGNIDADPCFVDADNGDYHLLFSSPCIDAGEPDYIPSPGEKDIDGEPRVIGGRVDMGVDEFISMLTTILRVSPTEFQFSSYENGPNPKEQIMSIRNTGIGTLNWEITCDCPWLDVYPASGESTGQMNEVTLSVDISGMEPGSYECLLTIDAHDVLNSPQMVTVTLNLGGSELFVPSEYGTIQAAIDVAIDWDTVIVAEGTYTGNGNRDIDFHGKEITVRSDNGPENCIIDCNGTEGEPHRGFYFHSGEDTNSILSGFTITNGQGLEEQFGSNMWSLGGGIYCIGSGPRIANCIIRDNLATQGGGIFAWENSSPRITDCTVSGNSSGVYCWRNSSLDIEDSIISGTGGRGIYCWDSPTVSIVNCTISDNLSEGIRCDGYGPLVINNCTIFNNQDSGIQALIQGTGNATISNCVISGNNASFNGGGIRISTVEQGLATITNCTITGNSAIDSFGNVGRGGGMSCSRGNIIIANSIIRNNISEDIYIWNFPPPPCLGCTVEPTEVAISYSCTGQIIVEEDPFSGGGPILILGAGNIDADPCFIEAGYLDANGLWIDGNYHLLPYSMCIDAGDPNYIAEPNETDLDGRPRIIGGRIDMGAYEFTSIQAEIRIIPRTINLASNSKWLTCYIWLPDDYSVADIDSNSIFLNGKIQAESVGVNEKQQVAIAEFSREEVQTILNIGEVELSIIGWLTDATIFHGKDVIEVTNKRGEKPDKYVQASNPNPADGATGVDINADLSWTTGSYVTSHDVYFGTSSSPPFVFNQTATIFDPGTMDRGLTYYWRIDEVNKWGKTTGSVWSFTTTEAPPPPPPPPSPPPL
ncbi:MAG: right-handed parallel beta-helix repeat-containing protein [Planctomycetota bacterium]